MQDSENSEYLNIIIEMAQAKKERLEAIQRQENSTLVGKTTLIIQQYGIPGCVILVLISILIRICFGPFQWLGVVVLILFLLFIVFYYAYVFLELWNHRINIKSFFSSPFYHSFKRTINVSSSISNFYLPKLMKLSEKSLEIGIIELRNQYFNINKYFLLIDPIKFIGTFAAIVEATGTVFTFKIEMQTLWLYWAMVFIMALFIWSKIMRFHLTHWAHTITLTELALKQKQALKQNFKRASSTPNVIR